MALNAALIDIAQDAEPQPVEFAYAVALNAKTLAPVVEAMQTAIAGDTDQLIHAFDEHRSALARAHARLDEDGAPLIRDGNYVIADPDAFAEAFAALKAKHDIDAVLAARNAREADLLALPADPITLRMVGLDQLPAQNRVATLMRLLPMIATPA